MKNIISISGIIGVAAILLFSLLDRWFFISDSFYYGGTAVGVGLFVPMLIRELFYIKKNKKETEKKTEKEE